MDIQSNQPTRDWQMEAFVGPNFEYYERKWGLNPGAMDWNWAACLFGIFWAAYRKMYAEAAIAFSIVTVLSVIGLRSSIMFGVAFGLVGNHLYRKRFEVILKEAEGLDLGAQSEMLAKKGGTSPLIAIALLAAWILIVFIPLP